MTIDYGPRARLGVLVPSGNIVAEPELRAMLPPGVGLFVTRLPLTGSSEAELLAMLDTLETGTKLLADARPDAIAFHCTAVSTFAPHMAGDIRARMGRASTIPALATADAILAALTALGAARVLLVTPYIQAVHQREIDWLAACGFSVTGGGCMGIETNAEMGRLTPEAITDRVIAEARGVPTIAGSPGVPTIAESPGVPTIAGSPGVPTMAGSSGVPAAPGSRDIPADVCFISCTAIRSAGVIERLETALGMPVITSNQALAWHALRVLGIGDLPPGFGRLFDAPAALRTAA